MRTPGLKNTMNQSTDVFKRLKTQWLVGFGSLGVVFSHDEMKHDGWGWLWFPDCVASWAAVEAVFQVLYGVTVPGWQHC